MNALIIEDEAPAFRRLQKVLEEIDPQIKIVDVLDSVEDSVKWFKQNNPPDLIFMDIQLSDGISFEIFESVKITKPVIFTTAYDEYMLRAFKVNSIDYLLKPIKKEELTNSIQKFRELHVQSGTLNSVPNLNELIKHITLNEKRYRSRFLIKKGEELISIETSSIAFFQSRNGMIYLYNTGGNTYIMDITLDELMTQLDTEKFFRANRQFIVSYDAVEKTHKYHKGKLVVEMSIPSDEPITVSSEKASLFKEWLGS